MEVLAWSDSLVQMDGLFCIKCMDSSGWTVFTCCLKSRLGVVRVMLEGWGGEEDVPSHCSNNDDDHYTNKVIALGYALFLSCCVPFCTLGDGCLVCLDSYVVVHDLCAISFSKVVFSMWVLFNFAMRQSCSFGLSLGCSW